MTHSRPTLLGALGTGLVLRGRTEDNVVEALGHILSTTKARAALSHIVKTGGAPLGVIERVRTHVTDEEGGGAQPSVADFGESGHDRALIGAKVWASLTENQPIAYLKPLRATQPPALPVDVRAAQVESLCAELRHRVSEPTSDIELASLRRTGPVRRAAVSRGTSRLTLTSWRAQLDRMHATAATRVRAGAARTARGLAVAKDAAAGGLTAARTNSADALKGAADKTATAVRLGVAGAAAGLAATSAAAVPRLHSSAEVAGAAVRSGASGIAAGFSTAHGALATFAENLDWSTIDPTKYLYAGTRGLSRGLDEARLVWQSIPERLRALGPEEVANRLEGFDWSHIRPYSQGGGHEASNGIFERASLNRSRGAERMTPAEVQAAGHVLSEQAFQAALVETASQVFTGAVAAAAVACVLSALEHGLKYRRREITLDEMYQRIGAAVARSAAVGGAVAGVMAVVALAFPALIPLAAPLMMPLAVLGLCAVVGRVVQLATEWYEFSQGLHIPSSPAGLPSTLYRLPREGRFGPATAL